MSAHRHLRLVQFAPEPQSETRIRTEPSTITRISPPRTRADCIESHRPCPWIECRYSLVGERGNAARGKVYHYNHGDHETPLESIAHTCALDVAADGAHTFEEVSQMLGVSKQRIQQLSDAAFAKLASALERRGFTAEDVREALASHGENIEPEGFT